ncbi:MAG: helix-turn-helix transcriptional regulator, partial [Candidatus Lokiarchaeota archaeon]|nr:helix-turn-helix transcriptional regulator [Candidatus Lokiarchaeota archaeon]
ASSVTPSIHTRLPVALARPGPGTAGDPVGTIDAFEHRIREHFTGMGKMMGQDPTAAAVLARFYMRPAWTQKELQAATGISAGAVSEALKALSGRGLLTVAASRRGPWQYRMESIPGAVSRFFDLVVSVVTVHEEEFRQMKQDLERMPAEAIATPPGDGIARFLDLYFKMLPVYKDIARLARRLADGNRR